MDPIEENIICFVDRDAIQTPSSIANDNERETIIDCVLAILSVFRNSSVAMEYRSGIRDA